MFAQFVHQTLFQLEYQLKMDAFAKQPQLPIIGMHRLKFVQHALLLDVQFNLKTKDVHHLII